MKRKKKDCSNFFTTHKLEENDTLWSMRVIRNHSGSMARFGKIQYTATTVKPG